MTSHLTMQYSGIQSLQLCLVNDTNEDPLYFLLRQIRQSSYRQNIVQESNTTWDSGFHHNQQKNLPRNRPLHRELRRRFDKTLSYRPMTLQFSTYTLVNSRKYHWWSGEIFSNMFCLKSKKSFKYIPIQ